MVIDHSSPASLRRSLFATIVPAVPAPRMRRRFTTDHPTLFSEMCCDPSIVAVSDPAEQGRKAYVYLTDAGRDDVLHLEPSAFPRRQRVLRPA